MSASVNSARTCRNGYCAISRGVVNVSPYWMAVTWWALGLSRETPSVFSRWALLSGVIRYGTGIQPSARRLPAPRPSPRTASFVISGVLTNLDHSISPAATSVTFCPAAACQGTPARRARIATRAVMISSGDSGSLPSHARRVGQGPGRCPAPSPVARDDERVLLFGLHLQLD